MSLRLITQVPEFAIKYVQTIKEDDLIEALKKNQRRFRKTLRDISEKKSLHSYAEGKWTLKEVVQHIIDAERVFTYRALSFTRKDQSALPGFEENAWAFNSKAASRDWEDLLSEFEILRDANILFFASLDEEQLRATGTANGNTLNVAGLGFMCAGHCQHHLNIIKERYLPTLKKRKSEGKEKSDDPIVELDA